MLIAICVAESTLGTKYVSPNIETGYFNCGGIKSADILKTGKADANGSWLRQYDSWDDFFATAGEMLRTGYFEKDCRSAECIGRYWVENGASGRWLKVVNQTLMALK